MRGAPSFVAELGTVLGIDILAPRGLQSLSFLNPRIWGSEATLAPALSTMSKRLSAITRHP